MGKVIGLFVVGLALVIGLSVASPLAQSVDDWNDAARRRRELQLAEQQYEFYRKQQWDAATAPGRVAANYLWTTLAIVVAAGAVLKLSHAYDRAQARKDEDRQVIYPDARGLLPVPRVQLAAGEPMDDRLLDLPTLYRQAEIARAVHQPGQSPASLHYSPSITHTPAQISADAPPALVDSGQPLPGLTDLADVLTTFRPAAGRVLLALGPGGQPITVGVKQLCHVALVGATGGGKSNLLRLLLPQLQSLGAKIVLADPHFAPFDPESGEDWRQIAARLYMRPAVRGGEIADLLRWLCEQIDLRLSLRRRGERVGRPLFLAFDELPVITELVPDAMDAISRILREGRKVNVLTVGASQDMLVKTIGGSSAVRDCYRTAFYVGGDVISASRLLDLPQKQIDDGQLATGLAMLRSTATTPARLVRIPEATNGAIELLLGTSRVASDPTSGGASGDGDSEGGGSGAEVGVEVGSEAPTSRHQDAVNPQFSRVREMLREKRPQNEIIERVWGVTGGRAYQQAAEEFRAIVAQLVGGASS